MSHLDKKITKVINLVTSFYLPQNEERREEIIKALKQNISSPYIKKIHLYIDDQKAHTYLMNEIEDEERKIKIAGIGQQAKYSDYFWYCETKLQDEICMIANGDIWLKHIDNPMILNILMQKSVVFALTRHEYNMKAPLIDRYQGSHDVFMFGGGNINNSILNPTQFYKNIAIKQNIWGSENLIIEKLKERQNTILNPCKNIIIVHEHKTGLREENRESIMKHNYLMKIIETKYITNQGKSSPIYLYIYQDANKRIKYDTLLIKNELGNININYNSNKNIFYSGIQSHSGSQSYSPLKMIDRYRKPFG